MTRTITAIVAALALPFAGACEKEDHADEVGEVAEEIQEDRIEQRDVHGPLDEEIAGEIAEERFELIEETQQSGQEAMQREEDDILEAKPE